MNCCSRRASQCDKRATGAGILRHADSHAGASVRCFSFASSAVLCFSKNISDQLQYPACREIEERCVNIISNLFNGTGSAAPPEENDKQKQEGQNPSSDSTGPSGGQADQNAGSVGTSTVGSSEAVMLGALAMKWRWRQWRAKQAEKREKAAKGQPSDKPAHTDTAKDKDQHKQNKAPNPGGQFTQAAHWSLPWLAHALILSSCLRFCVFQLRSLRANLKLF